MPGTNTNNGKSNKNTNKPSDEKKNNGPKVLSNQQVNTSHSSPTKLNRLKKKSHKDGSSEKKEKRTKGESSEVSRNQNKKKSLSQEPSKGKKESISSLSDDGKKDEIQEVLSDATYDKANKLTKDMNEAGLDDDEIYPYYHKHPVLYGVFIPDKSSRELIYINKNHFTIGRNRLSDYVIPDRLISNNGIKITVNVKYDRAEFSVCRCSSSPVFVNDDIRLEFNSLKLYDGDSLTFADGSRYTFYNIFNKRDLDEMVADENCLIRYVRGSNFDETEKLPGSVSYLQNNTNFDRIEHKPVQSDRDDFFCFDEDMESLSSDDCEESALIPSLLVKDVKDNAMPEPVSEITPEVHEEEDLDDKTVNEMRKEVLDTVAKLNMMVTEGLKNRDGDEMLHGKPSNGNPFDDGENIVKTVVKDPKRKIFDEALERRRPRLAPFSDVFRIPYRGSSPRLFDKKPSLPFGYKPMTSSRKSEQYNEHIFVLYRSKHKTMISTRDVYDMIVDAFFKDMMDGIDLEDIRSVLSQNVRNQFTNYKQLFKETLLNDIVTPSKNTTTFENCGYYISESFQKYCCLLFQSCIENEKYREVKDGVETFNYIPQFVRMPCESGKKYMTNIIYAIAKQHNADVMLFNFEKNLLIEGTPLCYRKYLFGLFPSTIHIKPAVHSIPKKKSHSSQDVISELLIDDPYMVSDNMEVEDNDVNMMDDEGYEDLLDEEFLNGGSDMNGEPLSEEDKMDSKEEDTIMEGDIVVVSPLERKQLVSSKKPMMLRFPRYLPPLPEPSKYREKERRAVVVKDLGKRLIVRYLDKEESDDRSHSLRSRYSVDLSDSLVNTTNKPDIKKRCKSQLLARSLHACQRSQVRKWVDEDDQKFLLMKCVNEILADRNALAKKTNERTPLFIVFEDAPLLIRRRNANILTLLNIQERYSYPVFVILTEKVRYHNPQPQNDMMMIGGLNMNVIMGGSLRPKNENRSHIEQYFDNVMEKSFTLPYPGTELTTQTDIMILEVPTPQDTKYKYSFDKRIEEDEKAAMRVKHLKELSFFLRAQHLYCLDMNHIRYLDLKRIKNWIPIVRMAYSLQVTQGISYMKESDIFDVYSKTHDSIVRTGKPVYVSENPSDTLYGLIDRKNIEYAIKVSYNTEKESRPDPAQEIRCKNESEKRLIHNGSFISPNNITVGFDDVGSLENVKAKLRETIILPLRRPEIFAQSSLLKSCKGLLLFGPPGTGKTMLAKALARESGANFLSIATSTIFNKYVGDSEQNTRAIFTLAARLSPCVIFIDEIDSLLSSRDQNGSGQEYSRKVKNEFMSSWDGLMTDENLRVVVIGCTNRPFDLDDAVLRRFSRKLLVDLPDAEQREKILKVILRKEKLSNDVDLKEIASDTMTKGFSGSDLYNLCQTAAYMPIREIVAKEENNHSLTSQPKMDSMGLLSLEEEDDKMTVEEEQVQVRALTMKDFVDASKEITFSFEESNAAIRAIREWNEKYGDNGSRKTDDLSYYI